MVGRYDPDSVRRFFDEYGEEEWDRLAADPRGRVIFHVHRHYLEQFIRPGWRVLEAGAGPGRFTIELAKLGAAVTVADISPVQLRLNEAKVAEAGFGGCIEGRRLLDITDCSALPSERFDAVVCYGSALGYARDRAGDAMRGLLRVTRHGGYLLFSVSSRVIMHLPLLVEMARRGSLEAVGRYLETGDDDQDQMHCFLWSELRDLIESCGGEVVAASASNLMATVAGMEALQEIERDPAFWEAFLRWEVTLCQEPGVLDCGSHIIAVVRRP